MDDKLRLNPWLTIWTKPKETIKDIVAVNPKYRFLWLSAIYGFPCLLNIAQGISLIEVWPVILILLGALVFSTLVGAIAISVTAILIFWTGRWLKGAASYQTIRTAVAWSNVPNVVNVLIWLLMIGYFGGIIFSNGFPRISFMGVDQFVIMCVFLIQTITAVWSFVILVRGVAQVQRFTGWKALLNVALGLLIIFIAIWLLAIMTSGA